MNRRKLCLTPQYNLSSIPDLFEIICPKSRDDNWKSYLAKTAQTLGWSICKTKKLLQRNFAQPGATKELYLMAAEQLERDADEMAQIDFIEVINLYRSAAYTLRQMAGQQKVRGYQRRASAGRVSALAQ